MFRFEQKRITLDQLLIACFVFQEKLDRALKLEESKSSDIHPNYVGLYSALSTVAPSGAFIEGSLFGGPTGYLENSRRQDSGFGSENTSYVPMYPEVPPPPEPPRRRSKDSVYEQMWMSTSGKPVFINKNIKNNCNLKSFQMKALIGRGSFGKVGWIWALFQNQIII